MTRYVIDAPALLRIVGDPIRVDPAHQLVAPSRLRSEAMDLLLAAVRRGELTERETRARHTGLTELKLRALGDRVSRWTAFGLALEHDWPDVAHAEYVAVTRLQADALVALDPALAARAEGLVRLAPLEELLSAPE